MSLAVRDIVSHASNETRLVQAQGPGEGEASGLRGAIVKREHRTSFALSQVGR
jgi:hypothetical protein